MTKIKAAGVHLALSAAIVSILFAVIFFVWYPGTTFQIAGAMEIVFVLIGVDLVLGPLLTFIVYKHGKKSLKFDLSVIALVQIGALIYGAHTLYLERPYYMVFAVDRFNIVSAKDIDTAQIRYDELKKKPFADVIKVFARLPEDQDEFQAFLDSVIVEGQADLERRPEYWEPYENGKGYIASRIRPLTELNMKTAKDQQRAARAAARYQDEHPDIGFIPVGTLTEDIGMVMDADTVEPLGIVKVNPWDDPVKDSDGTPAGAAAEPGQGESSS